MVKCLLNITPDDDTPKEIPEELEELFKEHNIEFQIPFERLLKTSDIISIHVPLNPETEGLFGKNELGKMKKNAILINTARGAIVNEMALYKALEERRIFGAGISVFTKEPLEEGHPFYKIGDKLDNLVLIPHVGVTFNTVKAMYLSAANDTIAILEGRKPKYPLNSEVLDRKNV